MSTFKTCLIQDSRISNITDEETFCVMDGASQSTFQDFAATSASSSSIVFNIQIPSENIVIDRHLLLQSTITLKLTLAAANVTTDTLVFDYGLTDSLQAFPFNSLCTTQQMTINNATVSQNTKDILPMLLRLYDRRKLNRYNSLCPSLPDCFYAEYANGLGAINNVLAGYNNQSLDEDFVPRGAFPVTIVNVLHSFIPDGSTDVTYNNQLINKAGSTNNVWEIILQFTTTEPFIALSPWTNTNANNQAGLVGVNNISCNLNIDSSCSRVFSTMNEYITNISLGATNVVENQFATAVANPEICIITVNSGIFTTQLGTSIINTGILTKEDVLRTKEQQPKMDTTDYRRYVGGNLANMGMSNVLKLVKKHIKGFLNDQSTPGEEQPITASGFSGGSTSGGRISRLSKYTR